MTDGLLHKSWQLVAHCWRHCSTSQHHAHCLQEPDPDKNTPGPGTYLQQQRLRPQSAPQPVAAGFTPAHSSQHQQQLFGRGPGRQCAIAGLPGVMQPSSVAPGVSVCTPCCRLGTQFVSATICLAAKLTNGLCRMQPHVFVPKSGVRVVDLIILPFMPHCCCSTLLQVADVNCHTGGCAVVLQPGTYDLSKAGSLTKTVRSSRAGLLHGSGVTTSAVAATVHADQDAGQAAAGFGSTSNRFGDANVNSPGPGACCHCPTPANLLWHASFRVLCSCTNTAGERCRNGIS